MVSYLIWLKQSALGCKYLPFNLTRITKLQLLFLFRDGSSAVYIIVVLTPTWALIGFCSPYWLYTIRGHMLESPQLSVKTGSVHPTNSYTLLSDSNSISEGQETIFGGSLSEIEQKEVQYYWLAALCIRTNLQTLSRVKLSIKKFTKSLHMSKHLQNFMWCETKMLQPYHSLSTILTI